MSVLSARRPAKATRFPSGDHIGVKYSPWAAVSRCSPVPSSVTTKIPGVPNRRLAKAMIPGWPKAALPGPVGVVAPVPTPVPPVPTVPAPDGPVVDEPDPTSGPPVASGPAAPAAAVVDEAAPPAPLG